MSLSVVEKSIKPVSFMIKSKRGKIMGNPKMANSTALLVRAVMAESKVNKFEYPMEPQMIKGRKSDLFSIF